MPLSPIMNAEEAFQQACIDLLQECLITSCLENSEDRKKFLERLSELIQLMKSKGLTYLLRFPDFIREHFSQQKSLQPMQDILISLLDDSNGEIKLFALRAVMIMTFEYVCLGKRDELKLKFMVPLSKCFEDRSRIVRLWASPSIAYLTDTFDSKEVKENIETLSKVNHGFFNKYIRYAPLLKLEMEDKGAPLTLFMIGLALKLATNDHHDYILNQQLLKLILQNYQKQQSAAQSLPGPVYHFVLNCFDIPEVRNEAYVVYAWFIQWVGKGLKKTLMSKMFSKLHDYALSNDVALQDFVIQVLSKIKNYQKEKDDILSIVRQASNPKEQMVEVSEPSDEKSLDTLLAELKALNAGQPNVLELIAGHSLGDSLTALKMAYKSDSLFLPAGKPIEAWEVARCQAWAKAVIKNKEKARAKDFEAEIIAVMMRASVLDSGQMPRDIQLLVLLLFLKSEEKGCLAEVKTGEGKTKIVSMFSALRAFRYDYVDVVSSSAVLAKREPHELKNFYAILSLTVADNIDGRLHHGKSARPCYAANIVYGNTNEYQGDIIREMMGWGITRGDRPFSTLFFDEVDSLLVDRAKSAVMIVSPFPGMEYIKHMIVAVWHMAVRLAKSIRNEKDQWFYKSADGESEICFGNPYPFVIALLKKYIIQLVEDPESPVFMPKALKEFVLLEAEEFARAAALAYYGFQLDEHYVITENCKKCTGEVYPIISPVDSQLTGEIQKNTRWTYIHCFLELKHELRMGEPQLMGNYLSTAGFCQRYGNKIYGLTGTLGGADAQALLREAYHVDLVFVPTYKPKCFVEYDGIVAKNKATWLASIVRQVKDEIDKKRPVLVVAQTIAEVVFLEEALHKTKFCRKITRYSRDDTEEGEVPERDMEAGEVVISTLLAGRGIDWHFAKHQVDLIEKQGGLHVIVASLPPNLRVEQQIFGRTARKGNSGTAQIIVNREDVQRMVRREDIAYLNDVKNLKVWRDEVEARRVHGIKTKYIRLSLLKDDLYARFRQFINTIKRDELSLHRIKSIEEQWAIWLQRAFESVEDDFDLEATFGSVEEKFQAFMEMISHDEDIIRKNTCFQVQYGNVLNFGTADIKPNFSEAIDVFTKAISDDPVVGVQAYYNRAQAYIFQKGENYKEHALSDLKMAKDCLEKQIIPQLQSMLVVHQLNPITKNGFNSDFAKQTHTKIEFLKLEIKNIDQNIRVIESSIKIAKKKKQKVDFEVTDYQELKLGDLFGEEESIPFSEINELYSSGLMHLFTVEPFFRRKKSSGFGAFCVAFLGVVQIVVGVLISYNMPMIGSALIQEGINDLMFSARVLLSNNFSWDAYLATKVGSVSVAVISMGLDILKNSADLEMATEAAKGKNTLENVLTRQLNHKKLFELAQEEVVARLIDTGLREVFNYSVDKLSTVAINGLKGDIKRLITRRLMESLSAPDCRIALHTMLQVDIDNKNTEMQGRLKQMAARAVYKKTSMFRSLANSIVKGVLSKQHKDVGAFLRIADIGRALDEALLLTDSFIDSFRSELLDFYQEYVVKIPNVVIDLNQVTVLKNEFYAEVARRLTKRIIATAKGEIINPSVDMAMSEHLNSLANTIKEVALRPVAPQHFLTPASAQHKIEEKQTSMSEELTEPTPAQFKQYLKSKRDSARREALTEAYKKTLKPAATQQEQAPVAVSKKTKKAKKAVRHPEPLIKKSELVKAGGVYTKQSDVKASPAASKALVPLQPAKLTPAKVSSEDLLDYLGAVASGGYKGIEKVLRGYAYALGHPFETLGALAKTPYDLGKFLHDAQMVGAKMAPMGQMVNFMDPDFTMLQHLVRQVPSIAAGSVERMSVRERAVMNKVQGFLNASGPAKTEMATELLTTFFGPGALAKGAIGVANLRQFGMITTPPLFHVVGGGNTVGRYNKGLERIITPAPSNLINMITPHERLRLLNQGNGEYLYAITKDNRLLVSDGWLKMARNDNKGKIPANMDMDRVISHPELAQSQPLYVAGKFRMVNGELTHITDYAWDYLPQGHHLKKFVERAFVKNGFHEARGKFETATVSFRPEAYNKLSYPAYLGAPKMLTVGSGVTTLLGQSENARQRRFEERMGVPPVFKDNAVPQRLSALKPMFISAEAYASDASNLMQIVHKPTMLPPSVEAMLPYANAIFSGAYQGFAKVLSGYAYALGHPFETLGATAKNMYEVGQFFYDAQSVGAKIAPMGHMVNVMDPDFTMLQHLVRRVPGIVSGSVARMDAREREITNEIQKFLNASGPGKTEKATEVLTSIFGPGWLARGAKMAVNYQKFGLLKTPPLFKNTLADEDWLIPLKFIETYTPEGVQTREHLGPINENMYMYAYTKDRKLIIARNRLKFPNNRDWDPFASSVKIFHSHLSGLEEVYFAGWFEAVGETVSSISVASGHFKPFGRHLKKFVERVFVENGFHDARGKFIPIDLASVASSQMAAFPAIPIITNDAILPRLIIASTFMTMKADRDAQRAEIHHGQWHQKPEVPVFNSNTTENESSLPAFLLEDLGGIMFRSRMKMGGLKSSPLMPFFLNFYGEFKSHDSMMQYYLDFAMMYPPMRYVEGAALVGQYAKENELSKKAFQSWGEKLKERDIFADDSFRAGVGLVLLEELATGFNAVKEYTAGQIKERLVTLEILAKLFATSSVVSLFVPPEPAPVGVDPVGRVEVVEAPVKLFDINRDKYYNNRHRFFFKDATGFDSQKTVLAGLMDEVKPKGPTVS